MRTDKPLILVLSPTRELAQQIAHESELLCTYHKFNTVVLVGNRAIWYLFLLQKTFFSVCQLFDVFQQLVFVFLTTVATFISYQLKYSMIAVEK